MRNVESETSAVPCGYRLVGSCFLREIDKIEREGYLLTVHVLHSGEHIASFYCQKLGNGTKDAAERRAYFGFAIA